MQKSKRTDDGWTVDDAPYFVSEFDAARAMSVMTDEPTFVLPFHGVEDFPPESAPLAVKSAQATSNGLIDPVMFGPNISGTIGASWISGDGAFQKTGDGNCSEGQLWGSNKADFSASRSSAIYSSSSTVQPAAVRSFFCIKI